MRNRRNSPTQMVGYEWLVSDARRKKIDIPFAAAAGAILAPLAAGAFIASAVELKEPWPIYVPPKDQRPYPDPNKLKARLAKIQTLHPAGKRPEEDGTEGTYHPGATRTGKIIRPLGLDEYPQVVNVALGDLSMVGIRPYTEEDYLKFQEANPALFMEWMEIVEDPEIRHGLFGPSQLAIRRVEEKTLDFFEGVMRRDIEYHRNATLVGDLALLARAPFQLGGIALGKVFKGALDRFGDETLA